MLQLSDHERPLQRAVPVHWQLGALDHGRSDLEPEGRSKVHGVQCRQPSERKGSLALRQLQEARLPTYPLRSKVWDEFGRPGAPQLDFVFTVCDNAAKEVCPIWPGQPMAAHWGVPDPADVAGTPEQIARAFRDAFIMLERRISLFVCLPLKSLDSLAIKKEIDRIGHE
jgi:arsenate reductase (thioredoxin)